LDDLPIRQVVCRFSSGGDGPVNAIYAQLIDVDWMEPERANRIPGKDQQENSRTPPVPAQGRWYVTHSGLIRLAERKRCAGINVNR
jgi:hypothetical protein